MSDRDTVRFYWSFRSPYAGFAVHRVESLLEGQGFAAAAGDAIFGVPTFVSRSRMFFGNDRLEWLVKAIEAGPVRGVRSMPTHRGKSQ